MALVHEREQYLLLRTGVPTWHLVKLGGVAPAAEASVVAAASASFLLRKVRSSISLTVR